MLGKNNKDDTVDSVIDEARQDYAFAIRGCGEKVGHYINRIKTAHDREVAELKNELNEWKSNCNFNHKDRKKKQMQIENLRKCLAEAIDAIDAISIRIGVATQVKSEDDYKRWRKALERNGNERN